MTNEELRQRNAKRRIHQIAFVTRDLERSMQAWIDDLGVGPWMVLTFTERSLTYLKVEGRTVTEPFEFLLALAWMGDTQIELIQPVHGPTIYEDHLRRKGEGLHHIKERIADADMDRVVAAYREKGIGVMQTGLFEGDVHYYLNTEPRLDFIHELGNCLDLKLRTEQYRVYPPE